MRAARRTGAAARPRHAPAPTRPGPQRPARSVTSARRSAAGRRPGPGRRPRRQPRRAPAGRHRGSRLAPPRRPTVRGPARASPGARPTPSVPDPLTVPVFARCVSVVAIGLVPPSPQGRQLADDGLQGSPSPAREPLARRRCRHGSETRGGARSAPTARTPRSWPGCAEATATRTRSWCVVMPRWRCARPPCSVPDADAEDVVQEAFVKAYGALGRFRDGAAFRPWLLQIVANETRNLHRSAGRRRGPGAVGLGADRAAAAGGRPPTTRRRPRCPASAGPSWCAAWPSCPTPHRQVVTCRYLLDLDEAETAAVLGWPRGTVKSRLHRALGTGWPTCSRSRRRRRTRSTSEVRRGA